MFKPLALLLITLTACSGCLSAAPATQAPASLEPLIAAIVQRVEIANDVALSKWYSGKAVQDSERERLVIAKAESQAGEFKMTREDVRPFMTSQIEANKMVQYARLAQWHESGRAPTEPPMSLTQGIRTRLDTLQPVLMEKYAAFLPHRNDPACQNWVQTQVHLQADDPIIVTALQRATDDLCLAKPTN